NSKLFPKNYHFFLLSILSAIAIKQYRMQSNRIPTTKLISFKAVHNSIIAKHVYFDTIKTNVILKNKHVRANYRHPPFKTVAFLTIPVYSKTGLAISVYRSFQ